MLAASTKPSASSHPSPSCIQTSTGSLDTSNPEPDAPAAKKAKRASIPVTLDLSVNLLDVHPLKIFHTVWCPDLQPQKLGIRSSCVYACISPGCNFQASKIGPVWSHIATEHTNREASCLLCKVLFINPYSMCEHIYLHFPEHKPGGKSSSQ